MEQGALKVNMLSIAGAGLLTFLIGAILLFVKGDLSGYIRFILPIPPLGVAAYIFVFNMYVSYGNNLVDNVGHVARDMALSVGIAAVVYGAFAVLLVVFIGFASRFF